ncbi:MAG: PorT family protein [Treponema sp.]|jgi:hypothetical protein|nr:PorT family protein [Treponema sp.]
MNSRLLRSLWAGAPVLILVLVPALLAAQTVPSRQGWGFTDEARAIVAVLPFVGEEDAARRFHGETMNAVAALTRYEGREVSASVFPEGTEIPTDMPPNRALVPAVRYALTGGVYGGDRPSEFYLQLWLWDMDGSMMIYTDDLVYDDIEGAMVSLPGLVEWLFSHIREVVEETPPEVLPPEWLYTFGVKTGLAPRWYVRPGEQISGAQSLGLEGGLTAAMHLSSLFALQVELLVSQDDLVYRGLTANDITYSEKLSSAFLTLPLFIRMNFKASSFKLSPMAGFYLALPLGQTRYSSSVDITAAYTHSGVLTGFSTGLEAVLNYGPGMFIVGLRYSGDFNHLVIDYDNPRDTVPDTSYRRDMFSLYLGYGFGFFDMNK